MRQGERAAAAKRMTCDASNRGIREVKDGGEHLGRRPSVHMWPQVLDTGGYRIETVAAQPGIFIFQVDPSAPEFLIAASSDDCTSFAGVNVSVDKVESCDDLLTE